jgi:hypothetical protein
MTKIVAFLSLLVTVLVCLLPVSPAMAQRARVFVASYGSDSNTCTFGSPCKTFQNAVNVVAAGGEVTAIDSAGFGPVTISHAVTITSPNGVEAGIAAAAGNYAVTVNAGSSDVVVLSGLTLEGAASASIGIVFNSGAEMEVVNCAIRNYTAIGISIAPSAPASILVSNTVISDIQYGIYLQPNAGGSIVAAFNGVTINNAQYGIFSDATHAPIEATVAESHIDNNTDYGIWAQGSSTSDTSNLILKNVTLNQTPYPLVLFQDASIWLSGVTQTSAPGIGSGVGVYIYTTGNGNNTIYSDGTNHIMGSIDNGSTTAWTPN